MSVFTLMQAVGPSAEELFSGIITPTNVVGGSFASDVFTKSAGTAWGNSGFSSVESIEGDGYIEWTVTEVNKHRIVGLLN